jgi:hypothetical protein
MQSAGRESGRRFLNIVNGKSRFAGSRGAVGYRRAFNKPAKCGSANMQTKIDTQVSSTILVGLC